MGVKCVQSIYFPFLGIAIDYLAIVELDARKGTPKRSFPFTMWERFRSTKPLSSGRLYSGLDLTDLEYRITIRC
jgi:hypothetical protein